MKSTMTVGKRFAVSSGALLVLCALMMLVSLWGFNNVRHDERSLSKDSVPGTLLSQTMDSDVLEIRSLYLQELLSQDAAETQELEQDLDTQYD